MDIVLYFGGLCVLALILLKVFFGMRSDLDAKLVANRGIPYQFVGLWMGIAFTWSATFFYASFLAYQQGLIGIGAFALGNTAGLVLAMLLARRIPVPEKKYSIAEAMGERYGKKTGKLYAFSIVGVQALFALSLQFLIVTSLLEATTQAPPMWTILSASGIMLLLLAIGGILSSAVLDIVKGGMMVGLIAVLAPLAVLNAGGIDAVLGGLAGSVGLPGAGDSTWSWLFVTGIPLIVALASAGPIDQSLFQRFFSTTRGPSRAVTLFMTVGAVFFVLNLAASSLLGFLAANPALGVEVTSVNVVGLTTLQTFAPGLAILFIITVMVAFIASGDTALNAATSIVVKDVLRERLARVSEDKVKSVQILAGALFIVPAAVIAYYRVDMITLSVMVGVFRASLLIPTIAAFYVSKERLPSVFGVIITAMFVSVLLYAPGTYCARESVTCALPFISAEGYALAGSLAGWTITGLYCIWVVMRRRSEPASALA